MSRYSANPPHTPAILQSRVERLSLFSIILLFNELIIFLSPPFGGGLGRGFRSLHLAQLEVGGREPGAIPIAGSTVAVGHTVADDAVGHFDVVDAYTAPSMSAGTGMWVTTPRLPGAAPGRRTAAA